MTDTNMTTNPITTDFTTVIAAVSGRGAVEPTTPGMLLYWLRASGMTTRRDDAETASDVARQVATMSDALQHGATLCHYSVGTAAGRPVMTWSLRAPTPTEVAEYHAKIERQVVHGAGLVADMRRKWGEDAAARELRAVSFECPHRRDEILALSLAQSRPRAPKSASEVAEDFWSRVVGA